MCLSTGTRPGASSPAMWCSGINLESSDCKIDWYLGDYIITTPDKFVIAFEGNRELSAIITYPDGRKERVATTINVPEAEEENDKK